MLSFETPLAPYNCPSRQSQLVFLSVSACLWVFVASESQCNSAFMPLVGLVCTVYAGYLCCVELRGTLQVLSVVAHVV